MQMGDWQKRKESEMKVLLLVSMFLSLTLISCTVKQLKYPVIILDKQTNLRVITSNPKEIKEIEKRNKIFDNIDVK